MTNPPPLQPQGPDEAIGLGVVSGGKSIPRPLPGRVMAGLAGAILAALGLAAYAAGDFLGADPIETGSIASRVAPPPPAEHHPRTPVATQKAASSAAEHAAATDARPGQAAPADVATDQVNDVRNDLRKQLDTATPPSSVLAPPARADDVAGLAPEVEVADSEAEVAKLEESLGMVEPAPETEMEIARLERAATQSDSALTSDDQTAAMGGPYIPVDGLRDARVTRYVNLRDGPADEARVIAVIPTNATVQAETNCGWCVVAYNGQRGYIYKDFLSGRGGSDAKASGGRTRAAKRLTGKPGLY